MEQPAADDDEDELDSLQPYTDKSLGQLIAETENWLRDGSPLRESTPRRFKAHLEPRRFILFPPRARAARNPFPHPLTPSLIRSRSPFALSTPLQTTLTTSTRYCDRCKHYSRTSPRAS